jgi:peptidoglycan/xylan/chitin deacetylase (PgdA/CDA1 family)
MSIEICRWKHGHTFAYSITYDEGFADLIDHALPVHQKYRIPGHLVMVAGQLGQMRDVPSSTYHGVRRHLSARQLRDLMREGWSVGDHSMTHGDLNINTYTEVVVSKQMLEEAIGQTVNLFHLPGADFSFAPAARYLEEAGFLAVFFADDCLNSHDPDLFALSRTLLYMIEGEPACSLYDPFPRVYDPYHRLHEALDIGGWIVDITHSIEPEPLAAWKDATPAVLDARFDCLRRVGHGREWAAEPEEIVDYILVRRAASVKDVQTQGNCLSFRLELGDIPTAVKCREISLTAHLDSAKSRPPTVLVDGKADAKIDSFVEDRLTFTWSVKSSQVVELNWAT